MATFRYRKTRNEPGFHGFTYSVYDNEGLVGSVRVKLKGGSNKGGPENWEGRRPWSWKLPNQEWSAGAINRNSAAGYLKGEQRRKKEGEAKQEVQPVRPQSYPGYPKTRWCPNFHGSHRFATPTEESLVRTCPECSANLVDSEPVRRSDFIDLPDLPKVRHERLAAVVSALQSGRHVFLSGTPGTGKSEIGRQAAEALGLSYGMIACDSSMTRSTLMGTMFPGKGGGEKYVTTPLREAVQNGGVFVLDEIDNGNPSLIAALNSAMSNMKVAFPDGVIDVHPDFRVIATGNTWGNGPTSEFVGRLRVDPATLDRFVRVYVGIDDDLEEKLTEASAGGDLTIAAEALTAVRGIRKRIDSEGIRIIMSPRASMQVASLMARGWTREDALMTTAVGTLDPAKALDLIGAK